MKIELRRQHVPDGQIEFVMDNLSGWVQKVIIEKIAVRKEAIISWKEFNHQFLVLIERSRCRELIDFTMQYSKDDDKVRNQVKTRPRYIKQLEAIDLTDEEIIDAVSDYLRADVNRQKWIDIEIIDEEVASDFESKLTKFWENQRKRIKIAEKKLGEIEQGQLLLIDCNSRKETIRDISPPSSTIPGAYHALADEPTIGWHPNWETIFPK